MRAIKNYEGLYSVTSCGKVWSHRRKKFLALVNNGKGYFTVSLYKKGKGERFYIHRLVALAFLKKPKEYKEVNHKNGIKTDNYVNNLEWCTRKENVKHALKTGLLKNIIGENHYKAKLSLYQVEIIRKLLKRNDIKQSEIAVFFDVSREIISKIKTGRTWK